MFYIEKRKKNRKKEKINRKKDELKERKEISNKKL